MKLRVVFLYISLFAFSGFALAKSTERLKQVNVFVGTDGHGHTFPGAILPHGMVQLSPDTRVTTWDGCSGYHYSDSRIMGFSHIHYSGVGSGGGADILLMPTLGSIKLNVGDSVVAGYGAKFSHQQESASPGYYQVKFENEIQVELTATLRTGLHKYTYPNVEKGNIILDLTHGINDSNDSLFIQRLSETKIQGFRHSSGGLDGNRIIYFVAEFSQPMVDYGLYRDDKLATGTTQAGGKNIKAHFSFNTQKIKEVLVKVAISRVDFAGAEKNLKGELPDWNFQAIREKAAQQWETELERISVEGGTAAQQRTFYTAMYHAFVHPNINMDFDRRYRSTDHQVYEAKNFDNYTTFSLWDTFRALHPLYTIIEPKRTNQFIRSFIERDQHFGSLPIMEFGGNEGFAMIGYHSLPLIADAYVKGIRDYDVKAAYEGMKRLSEGFRDGKEIYKKIGFIPYEAESQSVARTLEYSFDDWCVSRVAKDFKSSDFRRYSEKGQFYRNLYDPTVGFMRPRDENYQWLKGFNPLDGTGFTEGNAYQYSTFVPHDINGLIQLMGGEVKFDRWLDVCFSLKTDPSAANLQDLTGLIGQYSHGNEPSHNMAYLYSFIGKSWKTQQKARQIIDSFYDDQPTGLCGNDDAGQISAWYLFTSMGFYPATPGLANYVIGSPLFDKVTLNLENGKQFTIITHNNSATNLYVQSAKLNGINYSKSYFNHQDIVKGGELVFEMGDKPNKNWGSKSEDRPYTPKYDAPPMPRIEPQERSFLKSTTVKITCDDQSADLHFTTDGSEPSETSALYKQPLLVDHSATVKARSYRAGQNSSYTTVLELEKMTPSPAVMLKNPMPGLHYDYLEGYCVKVVDMKKYPTMSTGTIATFNISAITDKRSFGYTYKGYLYAPSTGVYTIYVNSNDGGIMSVDGKQIIDNDGFHRTQEKSKKVALSKGYHPILLYYFQMGGAKALSVSWEQPNKIKEEIPASVLFHE